MKVAFIVRSTLFTVKGGDTFQVIQTAGCLKQFGTLVDIKLTHEPIDYNQYNLLHFFNITRPSDILPHSIRTSVPYVVSPVLIDYSNYDKHYRQGLSGMLFRLLPAGAIEYLKAVARWIKGTEHALSATYLWQGQQRSIEKILKKCTLLLPNSSLEQQQLVQLYNISANYAIIPNGVGDSFFAPNSRIVKDPLLVLCVARIEGIKNQLNLIKALNHTPYKLVLIGAPAPNQLSYYQACRAIAGPNITFIDHLPQEELIPWYQQAKVHVLPSWFETCGLASLEAGAMGCNIVITEKGYTREYFEDYAFYCDPASPESIRQAVEKAARTPVSGQLRHKIIDHYTWQKAAEKTLAAYKQVLQKA